MFVLSVKNTKKETISFLLKKNITWNAGQYANQYRFSTPYIALLYSRFKEDEYTIATSINIDHKTVISLNVLKYIIKI